jgi:FkbM family methyltransferase
VATVSKEERTLFDELTGGPSADLLLFGAGNLGRHTLAGLRRVGREPLAFVDNDGSLHGTLVDGLPVLSPQEAGHRYGNTVVVVVTVWSPNQRLAYPNIAAQMSALGCSRTVTFVPLFWKYQEEFLPYFCLDAPHRLYAAAPAVKATLNLFADDRSCMEFLTQLSYLISSMDGVDLSATSEREWYFPRDLVELSDQEVFIDCGAYDGDTLESFLGATAYRFSAAVAFEPDSHAAARLRAVVQELPSGVRDRIQIEEKAVGGTPGMVRFEGGGTPGSRIVETGSVMVDCVTLDTAVLELAPTFIKMDIEGAEEAALLGAAETIRVHRPVLAICIYHLQADLYRLPTLMRRLCSNYALFLRRQARDSDLVCFAIPNERRRR